MTYLMQTLILASVDNTQFELFLLYYKIITMQMYNPKVIDRISNAVREICRQEISPPLLYNINKYKRIFTLVNVLLSP